MSKAFTRESDVPDQPILPRPSSTLPPGAKNYITPDGERQLREELKHLVEIKRPKLAGLAERSEARRDLQMLDQRIAVLHQSLQSAVIVQPPAVPDGQIRFGATVVVRDKTRTESQYRLVGVDETDLDRGWVSWCSPIARALLNAEAGQRIRVRLPSGNEELEIVRVTYE